MDATLFTKAGFLRINVTSSLGQIPVKDATVSITYTGEPGRVLEELTTDESGLTDTIELPAPDISYSLDPESEVQPYSEFTITVTASGYETVIVSGSEILAESLSTQPIRMNPLDATEEYEKRVVIPAHTLWGSYPAKIPESEVKPIAETGEIVLSRVVVPEYVIVHDGAPSDRTAQNYWVRYTDYIKNVASSEIYSTWPESTIYANVLAIMSFTLKLPPEPRLHGMVPQPGLQLYHYQFHRLRPEMDLRQEHLPEHQPDSGQHLYQLRFPSRYPPAAFYLLLRRAARDLFRFEPVGVQIPRRPELYRHPDFALLLRKRHLYQHRGYHFRRPFLLPRLRFNHRFLR